jgi:hypothetical protein
MESTAPESDPYFDAGWAEREGSWRRRLGRIRLGAEPLDQQLARHRRVARGLTIVAAIVAAQFVALFAAFHAPATGAIVAGVLFLPVVGLAWLEDWSLHRRVAAYLHERREYKAKTGKTTSDAPPEA